MTLHNKPAARHWVCTMTLRSALLLCAAGPAWTGDADPMAAPDDATSSAVMVSTVSYQIPDVQLVREDGKRVSLVQEMNDGRAVLLNFIFTTCSSFCPLSSQTFAEFQRNLGPDAGSVHLMSISIDPEQDTPARLREYAHKFGAGPGWTHYTGTLAASLSAQRAFGAYRGDKMSHTPLALLRPAAGSTWRRIEGFATPDDLLGQYHQSLALK
jgi:protein SCO1